MKLYKKMIRIITVTRSSKLLVNSFWGVFSNIVQNILFSFFFIILARVYSRSDFANYIIANSLYGMLVSFSSLGLAQWFMRESISVSNKKQFIDQYFKLQFLLGVFFYFLHVSVSLLLYDDQLIRSLSLLLGINIIFDNIIYVIKHVNVVGENQKKTFLIMTLEAGIKFLTGCILIFVSIPIVYLSVLLVLLRLITLNMFLYYGTSGLLSLKSMLNVKLKWYTALQVIQQNWPFVIIGSLSVIYWRIGNILVSKFLTVDMVADYEVSFKLFSLAEILPFIVSTSLFPKLVKASGQIAQPVQFPIRKIFFLYALYGLLAYTFIISYSGAVLPYLFGSEYVNTSLYCNQMFLTILVFPTALFQANLLVALKLEKIDMWLNLISLCLHIFLSLVGLYYFNSLSVVCYSIFASFLIFHLLQDYFLIRRKLMSLIHCLSFYIGSLLCIYFYDICSFWIDQRILFPIFWGSIFLLVAYVLYFLDRRNIYKIRITFSD